MSWMIMFMLAMAQVSGTYSWPKSFKGAGVRFLPLGLFLHGDLAV
jgi:hypothetical protein